MAIDDINVEEKIGHVGGLLKKEDGKRSVLIHFLQMIQSEEGYLPRDSLVKLSKKLRLPLNEIYSVASFYKQFDFKPRGRKTVKVCMGTACYVRGSENVLSGLKKEFGIQEGETTEDLLITLETVGCVGCCGLAPVATVNDALFGEIVSKKVGKLIKSLKE
ncbi:MAG: NAD(P)H-dependent oxidoreductase subunit E [Nitrospirae bacterium]|nr:NAD(P)H-dependent oxidoreductase subunit E [Nitrospirota bacterium]MCL5421800.1 NAD(P)H-dependent oxidoreductase subunit E [Nitrospirota bacterium]